MGENASLSKSQHSDLILEGAGAGTSLEYKWESKSTQAAAYLGIAKEYAPNRTQRLLKASSYFLFCL